MFFGEAFGVILNSVYCTNGTIGYEEQRKLYEVILGEDNHRSVEKASVFTHGCQKEEGVRQAKHQL